MYVLIILHILRDVDLVMDESEIGQYVDMYYLQMSDPKPHNRRPPNGEV